MADKTEKKTYATAFSFDVSFNGSIKVDDMGWMEVSGFNRELGVEEISEGGENKYVWRLPKPAKYKNLVLKRAVCLETDANTVRNWARNAIENFEIKPCDMVINLRDEHFNPIRTWNVVGAYPVRMETSPLDADKSELAIETLELAFKYFTEKEEKNDSKNQGTDNKGSSDK